MTDLLTGAARRDREDAEIVGARQVHDLLAGRDAALLAHLESNGVASAALAAATEFLDRDRAGYGEKAGRETSLDLPVETREALAAMLHGGLAEARRAAGECLDHHRDAASELDRVRSILHSIPEEEAVREVLGQRDALRSELAELEARDSALAKEIGRLEGDWEQGERRLEALLEAGVRDRERYDDRSRIIHCAAKVRDTLGEFQAATVRRHVTRIERLVLECYRHLLRKPSLAVRLVIDPETFAVSLVGRSGRELPTASLSAGERQLLALALLWGLGKSSGRPLPTAIDTPLGRLDSDHRRHFVERYLPFASHQTLLFSTDEEIVGDCLERLIPFVGRCYLLDHDDGKGCTRVRPGYFRGEKVEHGH